MVVKGIIKKGEYFDSVSLMIVARTINESGESIDSAVVMGTRENRSILENAGLLLTQFADSGDTDLLIAIKAESEEKAEKVLAMIEKQLLQLRNQDDSAEDFSPRSLEGALKHLPEANLSLISVAGKYAAGEAWKALENGLHVMIFSDNVDVEDEVELKKYAREKGLLVMGPDCGTAILNGVPLAFANVVNKGSIGVVAASGTGLQEVTCLISNAGEGISQAIGTGGRDIKKAVGGITFIQSIEALANDNDTQVILLVSKSAHEDVLAEVAKIVDKIDKPVAAVFLGADPEKMSAYNFKTAVTLEEAAKLAVSLLKEPAQAAAAPEDDLQQIAQQEAALISGKAQKYLRALYSGGTFCSEAQVILGGDMKNIYTNAPLGDSLQVENPRKSQMNTIVDVGEDDFTKGKPHPMIDYSYRNQRIMEEARDPETAVILLDVVLGYGSNPDPLPELLPVIERARKIAKEDGRYIPFICSVTGTDDDPQNRSKVINGLESTGARILKSNAAACKTASYILKR
ncbi:MAG: acyl-CoA synthetase FdrA [bacterium]|nr:acyl-CoA synthetase FdrA [bacterium]